jgi:flavin reductase (DIM6/NTAB) family NADH-FMN oxidoreductase RutF
MSRIPFPVGILSTNDIKTNKIISSTISSFASADSASDFNAISFNLKKNSFLASILLTDKKVSINFLSSDQEFIANNFAKYRVENDFGNAISSKGNGEMIIKGAYASIHGTVNSFYDLDSSRVFVIKVQTVEQWNLNKKPLIYFNRKYLTI